MQVIGLGEKWKGGDMKRAGGGYKINLLREALKPYRDDDQRIIMFTDRYANLNLLYVIMNLFFTAQEIDSVFESKLFFIILTYTCKKLCDHSWRRGVEKILEYV